MFNPLSLREEHSCLSLRGTKQPKVVVSDLKFCASLPRRSISLHFSQRRWLNTSLLYCSVRGNPFSVLGVGVEPTTLRSSGECSNQLSYPSVLLCYYLMLTTVIKCFVFTAVLVEIYMHLKFSQNLLQYFYKHQEYLQ